MHQGVTSHSVSNMTGLVQKQTLPGGKGLQRSTKRACFVCVALKVMQSGLSYLLSNQKTMTAGRTQRTIRHLAYVGHTGDDSRVNVIFIHHSIYHTFFFIYSRNNMKMQRKRQPQTHQGGQYIVSQDLKLFCIY